METSHVFVYGTLRQGGVREMPTLFPEADFVGRSSIRGYLYDLGAYPGIILDPAGMEIVGEIYAVTPPILEQLDEIEHYIPGDPSSYYQRLSIAVAAPTSGSPAGGQPIACWIYECNRRFYALETLIESGDWIRHERDRGYTVAERWPGDA